MSFLYTSRQGEGGDVFLGGQALPMLQVSRPVSSLVPETMGGVYFKKLKPPDQRRHHCACV